MQIYEISLPIPVVEVNYGAAARELGKAAGAAARNYFGMQPSQDAQVQGAEAQQLAMQHAQAVIRQQVMSQKTLWDRSLKNMMTTAGANQQTALDPRDLASSFMQQLQSMLRPHGLTASMANVGGIPQPVLDDFSTKIRNRQNPAVVQNIRSSRQQVNSAVNAILQGVNDEGAWLALSQGIANAANLLAFQADPAQRSQPQVAPNPLSTRAAQAMSALGTTNSGIQNFASLVQQSGSSVSPTGNPIIDDLLRHMRLIP
jgi:hypothetical protein